MARIASEENSPSLKGIKNRKVLSALFWCAIIGLELFLLLNDITVFRSPKSETPEKTGERIAQLLEKRNGVRWQDPKDVVWNETSVGQALFEGQSLMTLSDSSARLSFDARLGPDAHNIEWISGDTELEIGPKTLIQLKRLQPETPGGETPLLVLLERGKLQSFTTKRKVRLQVAQKEIEIAAGSKFVAEAKTPSEVSVKITEGTARVLDAAKTPEIQAGQTLRLSPTEAAPVITSEAAPSPVASPTPSPSPSPSPTATAAPSPTPTVKPAPRPTKKVLRALPPPKVQAPILRERVKPKPSPKTSFWRFLIPDAQADEEVPEFEIELRWDPVPSAAAYRIQISRTRNFSAPLLADEVTKDPKWIWIYRPGMENSKGRVFYRVATIGPEEKTGSFSSPTALNLPKPKKKEMVAEKPAPPPLPPTAPPLQFRPSPTPAAVSVVREPPRSAFRIAPLAQFGSFSQTTDSTLLEKAAVDSPYVSEGLRLEFQTARRSLTQFDFYANHFEDTSGTLAKIRAFRADLSYFLPPRAWGHRLAFGAIVSLDNHFEKDAPNSIELKNGIALGPALLFAAGRTRISLEVPLTGIVSHGTFGGDYGAKLTLEQRIPISRGGGLMPRDLIGELKGDYLFWGEPRGTKVTRWGVRVGPQWVIE